MTLRAGPHSQISAADGSPATPRGPPGLDAGVRRGSGERAVPLAPWRTAHPRRDRTPPRPARQDSRAGMSDASLKADHHARHAPHRGKTRLALELARAVEPSYPDGAALVELAAVVDPGLVPDAVAAALDVRALSGQNLVDAIVEFLAPHSLLLVIDNCEHLLARTAGLAGTVLRAAPQLTIVATSREPLHVPGEVVFRVASLDIPDPEQAIDADELLSYEAVRLFSPAAVSTTPRPRCRKRAESSRRPSALAGSQTHSLGSPRSHCYAAMRNGRLHCSARLASAVCCDTPTYVILMIPSPFPPCL